MKLLRLCSTSRLYSIRQARVLAPRMRTISSGLRPIQRLRPCFRLFHSLMARLLRTKTSRSTWPLSQPIAIRLVARMLNIFPLCTVASVSRRRSITGKLTEMSAFPSLSRHRRGTSSILHDTFSVAHDSVSFQASFVICCNLLSITTSFRSSCSLSFSFRFVLPLHFASP